MARIPLYNRTSETVAYAVVDDEDFEWLMEWRWHRSNKGYAVRRVPLPGRQGLLLMHRLILGLDFGDSRLGEHIDRDPLNNRRSNLRIVAGRAENAQNQSTTGRFRGRLRGVSFRRGTGKWRARVQVSGQMHSLGDHDTEEEAARVASEFRRLHMPYSTDDQLAPTLQETP